MTHNQKRSSISFFSLFAYAFRSFSRNKQKNIVSIITISFGLLTFIFMLSFIQGIYYQSMKSKANYETGYIQIMNSEYFDNPITPVEDTVAFPPALQQEIEALGWNASPHLLFNANMVLQTPPFPVDGSLNIAVLALDFERDRYMKKLLAQHLTETKDNASLDRVIEMLDNSDGVVIGKWLADRLSAQIGYNIALVTKGKGGFTEYLDLEIVGIIETQNPVLDREKLLMSYYNANEYLLADEYTTINLVQDVQFIPTLETLETDTAKIHALVQKEIGTHAVAKDLRTIQLKHNNIVVWEYPKGAAFIYMFIIFVIAATGISNSTSMNILSRKKQIGTMQSFGLTIRQVRLLYTLETFFIGLVAAIISCIAGVGVMALMVNYGLDYTAFMQETTFGFPSTGKFYGAWVFDSFITVFIVGISFPIIVQYLTLFYLRKKYSNIIDLLRAQT